jgi:hypothetical protein
MANGYLHRLEKLEAEHAHVAQPLRPFVIEFVNAQREAITLLANGQWFHRADGESEDEFRVRAGRAVGWDD